MDTHAVSTPDFADGSLRDDDDDDIRGQNVSSGGRLDSRPTMNRHYSGRDGPIRRILRFFHSRGDQGYRQLQSRVASTDGSLALDDAEYVPTSCIDSFRLMITSSWLNLLLVFVPIGIFSYLAHLSAILVFTSNAIAVIPLSSLLTAATERVASDAGDTVGALLNISLGNLVELILFIVALVNNQIRVVQASILGSILVNSLLILGSALLGTGLSGKEPAYNTAETQLLSSLLFASVFVFLMPTAFGYTFDHTRVSKATLQMSRVSSLMVLLIYLLYFVHELRARPTRSPESPTESDDDSERGPAMSELLPLTPLTPLAPLNGTSDLSGLPFRTIRFADEHATQEPRFKVSDSLELERLDGNGITHANRDVPVIVVPGRSGESNGRLNAIQPPPRPRSSHTPSIAADPHRGRRRASSLSGLSGNAGFTGLGGPGLMRSGLAALQIMRENNQSGLDGVADLRSMRPATPHGVQHRPRGEFLMSVIVLMVASALMSVNAEFLVDTIDDVTHQGHLSESVIGLIILPIVGNIAEYVTVVSVALRDKLDLAISVAIGSSIQIALCVTPLTVGAGWILNRDLSLTFSFFEMAALVGTALLVGLLVSSDGDRKLRTCGLKGALMCACYIIIGFGAYLSPNDDTPQ